jgi:hypothetical protein
VPTFKEQQHQNFDEMKKRETDVPSQTFIKTCDVDLSESLNYLFDNEQGRRSREILKKTLVGEAADEFHPPMTTIS